MVSEAVSEAVMVVSEAVIVVSEAGFNNSNKQQANFVFNSVKDERSDSTIFKEKMPNALQR
ncbi:5537_t:CDS:2 [Cetraspora pellucida]|uniref:5537_t:CDS:1 n=1 Tax=Cetraspora pellucida TaxID=1433469 RepID=A0A9N9E3L6_9GLOM|nr:5537_t:CDS:2 [Cetraspora pellucida]